MASLSKSRYLRILGFEPFDAGSHRAVREAISKHSRHEWTWITRPGRNWMWRMRLAAVEMVDEAVRENRLERGPFDAVFVTSLMSAADLRAFLPAEMRALPLILYMHENQAAYPAGFETEESRQRDVQFAMTNLTSILAADCVIWNSQWNQQSFIEGIEFLLRKGSDVRVREVRWRIEAKSSTVWPSVDVPRELIADMDDGGGWTKSQAMGRGVLHNESRPVRVVWPHRWEHDKGPDELLVLAERWSEELNLRWTILGERYGQVPPEMEEFAQRFRERIDYMGYIADRAAYLAKLRECDWVLSTAKHEFFGIAVVEALLAGCLPWLPERLSYPELLPEVAKGMSPMNPPPDPDAVCAAIRKHLEPAFAANAVARLDTVIEQSTHCV